MPNPASLARRARSHIVQRRHAARFAAGLDVSPRDDLLEVGDLNYGGYILPTLLLSQDSVCYLAGTGEDISFDLSVIARFGCEVHSLDPVPRGHAGGSSQKTIIRLGMSPLRQLMQHRSGRAAT